MGERKNRIKGFKKKIQPIKEYILSYQSALKALLATLPTQADKSVRSSVVTVGRCDIWPCEDAAVVLYYRNESESIEVNIKNPLTKTAKEFQQTGAACAYFDESGEQSSVRPILNFDDAEEHILHIMELEFNKNDQQFFSPRFQKMSFFGWNAPLQKPYEQALEDFNIAHKLLGKPIYIHPSIEGNLIPSDLLIPEAGFQCYLTAKDIKMPTLLFLASSGDFYFSLHIQNCYLVLMRNEYIVALPLIDLENVSTIPKDHKYRINVYWNYHELILRRQQGNKEFEERVSTPATIPSSELIKWAREQNLLKVIEYSSEEEFRAKVYSCLESVQDKIDEGIGVNSFWDISYSGNTIEARTPKKETDIHEYVHRMLSDQMLMASIEVVPEYRSGVGSLDFMFLGHIKNSGICRMCAEFKPAHSDDLLHGLETQLPLYMQNKNARYGAYCVLWFKGEWWKNPQDETCDAFYNRLWCEKVKSRNPLMEGIRILVFDLAKELSASKRRVNK
ncbi:MAG: hypothetical protein V7641_3563 [Blastocatellia bacterium]